jgi:hypothetical protein
MAEFGLKMEDDAKKATRPGEHVAAENVKDKDDEDKEDKIVESVEIKTTDEKSVENN